MIFIHQLKKLLNAKLFAKPGMVYTLCTIYLCFCAPFSQTTAMANEALEHQVKVAFIYNFIAFTQWPDDSTGNTINLCLLEKSFFGDAVNKLQNKPVNNHKIKIIYIKDLMELDNCQTIFFSKSIKKMLPSILSGLQGKPVLTLADTPKAISQGVTINMGVENEKINFEINLANARKSGLTISSKLLQLAHKVYQ